jgi:hypothetical protein
MTTMTQQVKTISVTQVQSYLTYLSGRITMQQFVDNYLYRNPPNVKMKAGTNFHCEIQGLPYEPDSRVVFDDNDMEEARLKVNKASNIFEYKIRKIYQTPSGPVMLTGVADQLLGNMVCEFKTTYSSFSYDNYAESVQWKAYCDLFDVELVKYQVWQLTEPNEETPEGKEAKPLRVKSYNEFVMESNTCTHHMFLEALYGATGLLQKLGIMRNKK